MTAVTRAVSAPVLPEPSRGSRSKSKLAANAVLVVILDVLHSAAAYRNVGDLSACLLFVDGSNLRWE